MSDSYTRMENSPSTPSGTSLHTIVVTPLRSREEIEWQGWRGEKELGDSEAAVSWLLKTGSYSEVRLLSLSQREYSRMAVRRGWKKSERPWEKEKREKREGRKRREEDNYER